MVACSKNTQVDMPLSMKKKTTKKKSTTTMKRSDNQSTGQSSSSIGESGTYSPSVTEGMGSISVDQGQHDVASVTKTGGRSWGKVALGTMLALDIAIGTSCVVYGALVNKLIPVMATLISYGSVLILGAFAGAVGLYTGACSRRGLQASAVFGFLVTLLDIGALITTLLLWDSFIVFLNENYDHLLLSEDSITTIQGLKILFVVIFCVLALLEFIRGVVMITKANGGMICCVAKRKRTDEFVRLDTSSLETPLLIWSQTRGQPTCDDYLECINNPVIDFSNVSLPAPPEDIDY